MSYPASWESDVVLADGGTIHVRPVQPRDAGAIAAFHGRQSPEHIYFRYFTPRPWLSPRDLDHLTQVDYADRMAFVAYLGDVLVGIARYDRYPTSSVAEVAFFTDGEHQGRGLATVLLEYLAAAAREAGIAGFVAQVLPQNRRMLSVFKKAGFTVQSRFTDGIIEVDLGIDPTPEARAAIEERARAAYARSVLRLLAPRSIAVVGASRDPESIGHQVLRRLVLGGFQGPVYPVNPVAHSIAGVRAYPSLAEVPDEVDLAVLCVPAASTLDVVAECGRKRVRGLVVISAGFAESGEAGATLEHAVVELARRHGMRVVGPNSMGIVNTDPAVALDATFVGPSALAGSIGVSSQSGTLGAAIIGHARRLGLGISTFVSIGNKADVSGNDLLAYWADDPATRLVLLHMESFGNPRNFARLTRRLTRTKPVVAVKAGRSVTLRDPGRVAASSEASLDALLAQTGVIRVDTLEQLFDVARVLQDQPLPRGDRVAVLSNSWGPAVLAADACVGAGLQLATLGPSAEAHVAAVRQSDPDAPAAGVAGLIDLGYRAGAEEYRHVLTALVADGAVDAVLVLCTPPVAATVQDVATAIEEVAAASDVPIVATFLGLDLQRAPRSQRPMLPIFDFPEAAAHALARVARYGAWLQQDDGTVAELPDALRAALRARVAQLQEAFARADAPSIGGALPPDLPPAPLAPVAPLLRTGTPDRATDEVRSRWISAPAAVDLLALAELPLVAREFVDDVEGAVAAAARIGWPIALKATGLARPARTEAGGVAVDVHDEVEVRQAFARMEELLGAAMHPAVVQAMAPAGVHCRISVQQHAEVGAVVLLGPDEGALGGTDTSVAVQVLPVSDVDARRLVDRSALRAQLDGLPDPESACDALAGLVGRLAAFADAVPEVLAVDLDPVLVSAAGAFVADVRVRVQDLPVPVEPQVRRL